MSGQNRALGLFENVHIHDGRNSQLKRPFLIKLFAAYIVLTFIYTGIISITFFYKNNELLKAEIDHKNRAFLEREKKQIDTKLAVAFNLVNQLKSNTLVIDYARNEEIDYYNILCILKELKRNQIAFSELGYTIGLTKLSDDLVITPYYTRTFNAYLKEIGLSSSEAESILNYFYNESESNAPLIFYGGRNYNLITSELPRPNNVVTIVRKESLITGQKILILLTFYEKFLLPDLKSTEESFLILDDLQVLTATPGYNKNLDLDMVRHSLLDKEEGNNKISVLEGYYRTTTSGKILYFTHSDVIYKWKYVYIVPQNILRKESMKLITQSVILYILLTAIGFAISFVVSQKIYQPIKNTVNKFSQYRSDSDHNYIKDEFAFIEETVADIKRAHDNLLKTLNSGRLSLKIKFMRDLLYGLVSHENVKRDIEKYELSYLNTGATVAILELTNYQELSNSFSKEAILNIMQQILVILKEQLRSQIRCEVFELDYRRLAVIMEGSNIEKMRRIFNNVLSNIEEKFELTLVVSIGKPVVDIEQIDKSFDIALNLLERRSVIDKRAILTYDDLSSEEKDSYYYPLSVERDLISYVVRAKREEAMTLLEKILSTNLIERDLGRETLSEFLFILVGTVNRILQQLNTTADEFFEEGKKLYLELKMYESRYDLKQKIMNIFDMIIEKIESKMEETDCSFTEQMIEFIHKNYSNPDLSLVDVAEHFNLSAAYVSRLFKSHVGENFKDYLNAYRIKKAKEFLDKKEIKIVELAKMVGFNHPNTFIRAFRKYEGVSPGQYLKRKC